MPGHNDTSAHPDRPCRAAAAASGPSDRAGAEPAALRCARECEDDPIARAASVLLVDHYDSYTGNIAQILWVLTGTEPRLVQSDLVDAAEIDAATHIVLGQGRARPSCSLSRAHPRRARRRARARVRRVLRLPGDDRGARRASREGAAARARARRSRDPRRVGDVRRRPRDLRRRAYHSLVVAEPAPFRITARSRDGLPMSGETEGRRWTGVQFHPESIGTRHGARMIETFLDERNRGCLSRPGAR